MKQIGFSFVNPAPQIEPAHVANFARKCEEIGAHSFWVLDRIAYDNLEPLTLLGVAGAVTKKIRLGTSVLLAATRHPTILAKTSATLDFLSGGRLTLGIGVGSREPDFAAVNVPYGHRGSRVEEAMQLVKQLWTGNPVTHHGRFYQVENLAVGPKPVQSPHPPIWMGGGGVDSALRRIARLADGYICGSSAVPNFANIWSKITDYAADIGRNPAEIEKAGLTFMALDPNKSHAIEACEAYLKRYYGAVRMEVEKTLLVGSAEACADKINSAFGNGLDTLIIGLVVPDLRQLDRFASQVMPRLELK
jgi:probable F420-dependent oxidoreductase